MVETPLNSFEKPVNTTELNTGTFIELQKSDPRLMSPEAARALLAAHDSFTKTPNIITEDEKNHAVILDFTRGLNETRTLVLGEIARRAA